MSVAEMIGIGGLDSPQDWQQVPLGLLFLAFWGVLAKVLISPDDGDASDACRPQPQVFGSYFSSIASAPAAKGPQKLASVAVDSKEVAAMLKTLQAAADRLSKEACAAIVEAIVTADASIAEATLANPYVEPVPEEPPAPEAPPPAEEAPAEAPEEAAPAEEEPAPAEVAAEEPEVPAAGPSKKTKKKKEKASREAAPVAEAPVEETEPTADDLLAVVEAADAAAEAEVEVFEEPAKQKKKKNRKKKLEEQAEEDEEEEEAAAQPPAVDSFVPVEAHPEEVEEAEDEQADEAAEEQEDDEEEEEAAEAEDAVAEAEEEEEGAAEEAAAEEEVEDDVLDESVEDDVLDETQDEEEDEEDEEAKEEAAEGPGEEAAAEEVAEEAAEEAAPEDEEEEEFEPPPPQPPTEIQKNILKVKKKIREIEGLEAKQEAGATLSANQVEKVAKKAELQTELDDLENTPEPHTIEWKATVVDYMKPLIGVMVKVEGQGADKGPFPLLAAHMDPPVDLDDLLSISTKYSKGAELKVRVLRNGENVTEMPLAKEEKRWKAVKRISEGLDELKKEDTRVTDMLWENCGSWSDEEFTGTTTLVKDFGVKVLTSFGRFVLVRPDDLKGEWRFKDPTSGISRPRKDMVSVGLTVQVRLKYVVNAKRDEDQNYFGSMIVSK